MIHSYARLIADYPCPPDGQSGAGPFATDLAAALSRAGFKPSSPQDNEYAYSVRCKSGIHEYEIMVAFDFVDRQSWEVSCPPTLGFFARLIGKNEIDDHTRIIRAIHESLQSNPRVSKLVWYPAY